MLVNAACLPGSQAELQRCPLPLGVCWSPAVPATGPPVVVQGSVAEWVCAGCTAVASGYCTVDAARRAWRCCFCGTLSPLPSGHEAAAPTTSERSSTNAGGDGAGGGVGPLAGPAALFRRPLAAPLSPTRAGEGGQTTARVLVFVVDGNTPGRQLQLLTASIDNILGRCEEVRRFAGLHAGSGVACGLWLP
jgi:hypothetical protein